MKYLIVSFVVAILVGIFAVQNSMIVSISFLGWSFDMSLVLVILISATFGAIVVLPPAMLVQYKLRRQINKLQSSHNSLESEHRMLQEQLQELQAVRDNAAENPQELPAEAEKETNL